VVSSVNDCHPGSARTSLERGSDAGDACTDHDDISRDDSHQVLVPVIRRSPAKSEVSLYT
jgi:hypothetical protein